MNLIFNHWHAFIPKGWNRAALHGQNLIQMGNRFYFMMITYRLFAGRESSWRAKCGLNRMYYMKYFLVQS